MRDGGSRPAPFMSVDTGGFGFVRSGPVSVRFRGGCGRASLPVQLRCGRCIADLHLRCGRCLALFGLPAASVWGGQGGACSFVAGASLFPWRGWMFWDRRQGREPENRPARTDVSENGPERRMPIQTLLSPAAWAGSGTLRGAFRSTCGSSRSQPIRSCRRRCPDGSAPR